MWQLQQLQGLPLEVKIRKTMERIREWYEFYGGEVYISFSGGKDSTVLLDIARRMYPDIEAVFVDTGLEYPEIREFVKTFENVTWLKPKMKFGEVIKKYGYPVISKEVANNVSGAKKGNTRYQKLMGTFKNKKTDKLSQFNIPKYKYLLDAPFDISDKCCEIIKKIPTKQFEKNTGKKPILGLMAEESQKRLKGWLKTGCNAYEKGRVQSQPMSFWIEQDILHYLKEFNIPYCSVYGEIIQSDQLEGQMSIEGTYKNLITSGCKRTGCMWCMFGVHLEAEPNRFQMMKETHPKQYDYCINTLGLGGYWTS